MSEEYTPDEIQAMMDAQAALDDPDPFWCEECGDPMEHGYGLCERCHAKRFGTPDDEDCEPIMIFVSAP